jgi:single-stranded-DNA-specific exonuclease
VHPHLDGYANPGLAGVGVAFKLAQALLGAVPTPQAGDATFLDGLLKLVALGTIADMMPLTGENALLVRRGLQALASANAPGLAALLKAARIEGGAVRGQDIAFGVAPRLNAVGRMGGAEDAVRLLLARDAQEAAALMARVEALNGERRQVQRELAAALDPPDGEPFDLVVEPTAHKGVIGIVAGQRMRESGRPSAVCTVLDGVAQCSLRAPEGYDLDALMAQARPFLASGGGHRAAAGMTFELSRLPFVRQVFNRGAEAQAAGRGPTFLPADGIGPALAPDEAALDTLEPFGQGFPPVLLVLEGRLAKSPQAFGQGHRKLFLEGMREPLTWFFAEDRASEEALKGTVRLAATPQDQPRWGRSWIVDGPVGPEAAAP